MNKTAAPGADGNISLSIAETPEEREDIFRFRYRIYVEELGKYALSSADSGNQILRDELDDTATLFQARKGGEIVGTLRLNRGSEGLLRKERFQAYDLGPFLSRYRPEELSFSSRLMVASEMRGTTVLGKILSYAYEYDLDNGVLFDFCHCEPNLVPVYQHLGYQTYTHNFEATEMGYRIPLALYLWDARHLRRTRSPFARILRQRPNDKPQDVSDWLCSTYKICQTNSRWLLSPAEWWNYMAKRLLASSNTHSPFLAGFSDDETKKLVASATLLNARPGDHIIREGDRGDEMYYLMSGIVEVRERNRKHLTSLGRGQVFGELTLIAAIQDEPHTSRSADVIVTGTDREGQCQVLVLTPSLLQRLARKEPVIVAKLASNLAAIVADRVMVNGLEGKQSSESYYLPVFRGFTEAEREELISLCELAEYAEGDYLIRANTVDNSLYVPLSGSIDILTSKGNFITTFRDEQAFGELIFLSALYDSIQGTHRRRTHARAATDARVLRIGTSTFRSIQESHPLLAIKLGFNLAAIARKRFLASNRYHPVQD